MVRKFLIASLAFGAVACMADDAIGRLRSYSVSRRYVAARDFTTIPGSVITYWYRDGQPDWKMPAVETNVLKVVTGRRISSAIETARDAAVADRDAALADLAKARADLNAKIAEFVSATNTVAILNKWKADREARAEETKTKINDSKLLTTTLKTWLTGLVDKIFSTEDD